MDSDFVKLESKNVKRIAIVGDLHGDFAALLEALKIINCKEDMVVFLGDYADRGKCGVEVIRKVSALKKQHPDQVFPLMGNHEDYTADGEPKFSPCSLIAEAEAKVGLWERFFRGTFAPFVTSLPLSALVPGNALLVHGGVSRKLTDIENLRSPSKQLRRDILWSDPFDGKGEQPNIRGAGVEFGWDVSASVCRLLGVERIIRSHQPTIAMDEPNVMHDGRVITVQCTSVYGGRPFVYFIDPKSAQKDSYRRL